MMCVSVVSNDVHVLVFAVLLNGLFHRSFSFTFHFACVGVGMFTLNRKPQNCRPFKRRAKFVVQPNIQLIIKSRTQHVLLALRLS